VPTTRLRPTSRQGSARSGSRSCSLIRSHLRTGEAYIDLQPEGIASAQAVRFDVLSGQLVDQYNTHLQRSLRRRAALDLGVRPFGYWPTSIILATTHWATAPLQLTWSPGAVIGDVAGPAQIVLNASQSAVGSIAMGGNFLPDGFGWSFSRPSGATVMLSPENVTAWLAATAANQQIAAVNSLAGATFMTDDYAPQGKFMRLNVSPSFSRWGQMLSYAASNSALYGNGRYRLFAYVRTWPSQSLPWQIAGDITGALSPVLAVLASAAPVATLLPAGNPSYKETVSTPTGAFQIVDLGEHPMPAASGINRPHFVRLWARPGGGTTNMGIATPHIDFGGFYMLPVHGEAGILPRGWIYPSWSNVVSSAGGLTEWHDIHGKLEVSGITNRIHRYDTGTASVGWPDVTGDESFYRDLGAVHRGALPRVSPSAVSLNIVVFHHRFGSGATNAMTHGGWYHQMGATLRYRPQFAFMNGNL
jgi:hypothetical protein